MRGAVWPISTSDFTLGGCNRCGVFLAVIVGIDPGSQYLGVGAIHVIGGAVQHLGHRTIAAKAKTYGQRLFEVGDGLREALEEWKPTIAVIERVFFAKNADSAFKLGQARGVAIYECARAGISISEYSAREIKMGICGSGSASKEQVQRLIMSLLKIPLSTEPIKVDATDALALAYHHATEMNIRERISKAESSQIRRKREVSP